MKKYYNMEFGTYRINQNNVILSIDKKQFDTQKIEDVEDISYADERFFKVSIEESNSHFNLIFDLDKESNNFKNLKKIKEEKLPVKLSIAKAILKQNVLETSGFSYVSINPSSIWYLPMRTVKYTYRANNSMPQGQHIEDFTKYKALVLYILTGANYEKLLTHTGILNNLKKKNPYLEALIEAPNLEKLYSALDEIEDIVNYKEWSTILNKEKKWKKITYGLIAVAILTNLGTAVAVTKSQQAIQKEKIAQVKKQGVSQSINSQIKESLKRKDFNTATKLMLQNNISYKKIGATLFSYKEYEKALVYDPSLLEKVITIYWNINEKDKIIDLKLSKEADKKYKEKLSLEQSIVSNNDEEMASNIAFISDRHTLLRIGLTYLENKDLLNVDTIVDKLTSLNYKNESSYLKSLKQVESLKTTISDFEKQVTTIEGENSENKEIQLKEINVKLDSAKEQLKDEEKKVKKYKGKLDEGN